VNPEKTAIVLIEYQNDFVKEGGALHAGVAQVMDDTDMLANSLALVEQARRLGATIMLVPISFAEGYPELPSEPYGIFKGVADSKAFRKGTWGAEIIDELKPMPDDLVIEGKRGLDCFFSTNLDFVLRQRGITNVALAGFLTNCCVESTMRSAYERGFQVVTLTDCTAALSDEEQRVAVEKDFAMFSRPMKHQAFLGELAVADSE
jgi:nicotinamidase-related amidase